MSVPLAREALTDPVTIAIAFVSLIILLTTELDTLWIILASAAISLSKDGRLSTPYGATFSQREKSPRAPRLPGPKGKIFEQSLFKIQNSC